jgi:Sap, sulfolipid-1-addressing protein
VRKGAAFIFGWLSSLALVIAITLTVTDNNPPKPSTAPSLAALAAKIAIGVALVVIAIRKRRKLSQPREPKRAPKWQTGIDNMSIWFAIALGPLTQPWGLVAAGVATIMEAKVSSWESSLALILFCFIATSTYLAMEIYVGFWPTKGQATLTRVRSWLDNNTDQVIIIVSLVLGFWLIANSIYFVVS